MLQVRTQKSGKGRIHPGKQAKSQPNRPAKQNLPKRKISDQIQLTIRQHHNTQSDKNNNRKLHGKRRSREAIRAEPRPGRKTIPHTKPQQGAETAQQKIDAERVTGPPHAARSQTGSTRHWLLTWSTGCASISKIQHGQDNHRPTDRGSASTSIAVSYTSNENLWLKLLTGPGDR